MNEPSMSPGTASVPDAQATLAAIVTERRRENARLAERDLREHIYTGRLHSDPRPSRWSM